MKRLVSIFLLLSANLYAAGFIDHTNGVPYIWKNFPITYRIDGGDLGAIPHDDPDGPLPADDPPGDFDDAVDLVEAAFDAWRNVPVAVVSFLPGADIENVAGPSLTPMTDPLVQCDPTTSAGLAYLQELATKCPSANFNNYVRLDQDGNPRSVTEDTVIIFDSDGSIFECLLGCGASVGTLGLASAGAFNESNHEIIAGLAIMNGRSNNEDKLRSTMTHEFGHLLNLAHAQLNYEQALFDSNAANDNSIPTMFPFIPKDPSSGDPTVTWTPELDDQFSLAFLYPNTAALQARGTIRGKILRRTGDGVRGVNVICRNDANPLVDAVTWISDQVLQNQGEYICGNLNAGSYSVSIEPIFLAINLFSPDPPFIVNEFYSGSEESYDPKIDPSSLTDTAEVKSFVTSVLGAPAEGINIILNEDGRLLSGKAVSGTSSEFFPQLEYFITVPPGAKKLKLQVKAENSNVDIDLLGRCDGEFSLPFTTTAAPLTPDSAAPGFTPQAEFAAEALGGNESMELNDTSSPKLKACTYHLLVINRSLGGSTNYDITATVEGATPRVTLRDEDINDTTSPSGETRMLTQRVIATADTYSMKSVKYTDVGKNDLSSITAANLYVDSDGDNEFTSQDQLLATAAFDLPTRSVTFSGFDQQFEPDSDKKLFVTYVFPSQASIPIWNLIWMIPLFTSFFLARQNRRTLMLGFFAVSFLVTCSKTPSYQPNIQSSSDVDITGLTFGTDIKITSGEVKSVKEFFDN